MRRQLEGSSSSILWHAKLLLLLLLLSSSFLYILRISIWERHPARRRGIAISAYSSSAWHGKAPYSSLLLPPLLWKCVSSCI